MTYRVEITLPSETWELLESARGHEPRASFVKRALESVLSGAEEPEQSLGRSVAAPARASELTTGREMYEAALAEAKKNPPQGRYPNFNQARKLR